jgi:hypothetical protein
MQTNHIKTPCYPVSLSDDLFDLLNTTLYHDVQNRMTLEKVTRHP